MNQTRMGLTPGEQEELWEHWNKGKSLSAIARMYGKHASAIFVVVGVRGGIYSPPRRRSSQALTLEEREVISRGIASSRSMRGIARELGRAASTISREINRNGGREGYRGVEADEQAWKRGHRPKRCKLSKSRRLRRIVEGKLRKDWSPEQISGWLKQRYPTKPGLQVSHETLYRTLFIQARGLLKKELMRHLRTKRRMRRSANASTKGNGRGQVIHGVSIRERPASVEDRAIPGHWEGDLISGSNNSHIATLVERHSRFVMLIKVSGKDSQSVVTALSKRVKRLPAELRRSLTWDRGSEMASHELFTLATNVDVYFCDPQSPWQRGSNENTNGLLRQYFPKGTDLSIHTQAELNRVAALLNGRPRKTLGFITPADKLRQSVATTH